MENHATVIINAASGSQDAQKLRETILTRFAGAGWQTKVIELEQGIPACDEAVKQAAADGHLVVAAGGDGTINAVANLCHRHKALMAVVPSGTFNYFARELTVPLDPAQAVDIAIGGEERVVGAGFVQDHLFLNNASFGLYTRIIRNREKDKALMGRSRLVAAFSAVATLIKGQKLFAIAINDGSQNIARGTNLVFVGNNTLQLENLGMGAAECTTRNRLAVVLMRRLSRWQLARVLFKGALRSLRQEEKLETFCATEFTVTTRRRVIEAVVDGEIVTLQTPLVFRRDPQALRVKVPLAAPAEVAA